MQHTPYFLLEDLRFVPQSQVLVPLFVMETVQGGKYATHHVGLSTILPLNGVSTAAAKCLLTDRPLVVIGSKGQGRQTVVGSTCGETPSKQSTTRRSDDMPLKFS